ncbi:MAG: sulfatase-like hydrolase/transferase [Pseudomonadota bacterium]
MSRPLNVLWMVTDHQAHGNRAAAPQINPLQARLASEGTRFARARSVLPVCSPARASMLTGLYPHAHGLTENDGRFGGRAGLDTGDRLIHQAFLESGYRCAWFGKWHVDNRRSAGDYGFEGFSLPGYGYPYGTADYRDYLERKGLAPPIAIIEMPGESGVAIGTKVSLTEAEDWFEYESGVAQLDGPAEVHEAFFLADLAGTWLESIGDAPFFVRIDPWGPHPPYTLSPPFLGLLQQSGVGLPANFSLDLTDRPAHHRRYRDYWSRTLSFGAEAWRSLTMRALECGALVETALIRILDTVDRLGLVDRTLVIFTADHGDAVGSNGGIANKGGLMVEETMRIPLALRGPRIPAGRTCDHLVSNLDIPQTILGMTGIAGGAGCHGRSLLEADGGLPSSGRRGLMVQHYGLHEPVVQRAYYWNDWKLVVQEDGFAELYNLATDPCEMQNRAGSAEHRCILRRLWSELQETMEETGDCDPRLVNILNGPGG